MIESDLIARLLPQLHATALGNLPFVSECEIIQWLDEAAKRLARITGLFVVRDTSIAMVAQQALYSLPARHVATVFVTHDGKLLKPTSTSQLRSLDPLYGIGAISTIPERWYEDKEGEGKIGLYPPPHAQAAAKQLGIVMLRYPPSLDCAKVTTTMVLPQVLEDALDIFAMSKAYGKESDFRCPEIANHLMQRFALYEQIAQSYWSQ